MKRAALVVLLLSLVVLTAAGLWLERGGNTPLASEPRPEVEYTVARGATANGQGAQLVAAGLIRDARLWRYHLWRRGGLRLKAGRFKLHAGLTLPQIASVLEGPPLPEDEPFAMIEGWRLRDTDAALAARGWIRPGEYLQAASNPSAFTAPFPLPLGTMEGYLYPETYRVVAKPLEVSALIQKQLNTFGERFYTPHRAEIEAGNRTLHQLVTMAAMLEREEPVPTQRPLVAGILWKRIDKGFPLGVDATSRYELEEWNDRVAFLKKLRNPQDAWNTRTRKGLPPGPIGAPTVDSLLAALRPTPSEFWYYLHDSKKQLHPSRNAQEHERLRAKHNVY
ncbi:MAG: endolytic transglycosylase MltG [Myxococcota bacterium]|nr:endolytic transglycosylase MltG [Myxococcota bacterium]